MASEIRMENPKTGVYKSAFYGFSWTTFFFGPWPALFRKDFITFIGFFVIFAIILFMTFGFGLLLINLIWAFIYNKYYTIQLLNKGYIFADLSVKNEDAARKLKIQLNENNCINQL